MNEDEEISCRDRTTLEDIDNTEVQSGQVGTGIGLPINIPSSLSDLPLLRPAPPIRFPPAFGQPISETQQTNITSQEEESRLAREEADKLAEKYADLLDKLETADTLNFDGEPEPGESPLLALGKSNLLISNSDFAGPTKQVYDNYFVQNIPVEDKIKYFNGSFYTLEENNSLKYFANYPDKSLIKTRSAIVTQQLTSIFPGNWETERRELYYLYFPKKFDQRPQTDLILKNTFLFGGKIPKATIQGQKEDVTVTKLIDDSKTFSDYSFVFQSPFENNETLKNINLIGASVIDVSTEYNFYIKEYEKIATKNNRQSKENIFPNLYLLTSIIGNNKNNALLESLVTLKNRVKNGNLFILNRNAKQLKEAKKSKILLGIKNNVGEYFDNFSLNYDKLEKQDSELYKSFDKQMSNIIFLTDATNKLNIINEKKYLFPMNIEFSIPTDKTTNVTRMLYDCSLMDNFMIKLFDLANKTNSTIEENIVSQKLLEQKVNQTIGQNTQQPTISTQFSSKRKKLNHYLMNDIFEQLNQDPIPPSTDDHIVIGDTKQYLRSNSSSMKFINSLRTKIFQGKLNTFIKTKLRTYKDILDEKKCYNETVAFKLSKYLKGQDKPIQSYWMPNNPDLDVLKIVDTQIKYEQEYTYKLSAFQFVLGNTYIQRAATPVSAFRESFLLFVDQAPDLRIIEVELLSTDKKVIDAPPLSPEIKFVPYFGVDNKIGLFLNGRTGEEKLEPISILDSDNQKIQTYEKFLDNRVLYKADDVAKRFEIMKLENKPKSYQDFKNGYIKTAETDVNPFTSQSATAASFIDSIEPNKKYYYAFRAVDVHEKISNPSPVYEIEMINDNGVILPVIKNFEFEKPKYENSLEIRRFLKILPAVQHTILDKEKSKLDSFKTANDALGKIKLGVSNVGVPWDKTFKLVATSKQTGKKIEIKFKFNYILE